MGKANLSFTFTFPALSIQHQPTYLAAVPLLDPDSSIIHTQFLVRGGGRAATSWFIHWVRPLKQNKTQTLFSSVQHEEHGAGAVLSGLWRDGETAHPAALPAQRLPAVRRWGVGTKRLSSSWPSPGAPLAGRHS